MSSGLNPLSVVGNSVTLCEGMRPLAGRTRYPRQPLHGTVTNPGQLMARNEAPLPRVSAGPNSLRARTDCRRTRHRLANQTSMEKLRFGKYDLRHAPYQVLKNAGIRRKRMPRCLACSVPDSSRAEPCLYARLRPEAAKVSVTPSACVQANPVALASGRQLRLRITAEGASRVYCGSRLLSGTRP